MVLRQSRSVITPTVSLGNDLFTDENSVNRNKQLTRY